MKKKRVLIGACGIGNGHVMRQSELVDALLPDHDVVMLVSGEYVGFKKASCEVVSAPLPWLVTDPQGMNWLESGQQGVNAQINYQTISQKLAEACEKLGGAPDIVVSDYEPFSAWLAYSNDVPLVSVDQQSKYLGYKTPPLDSKTREMEAARLRLILPRADARISASFFGMDDYEPVEKYPVDVVSTIVPNGLGKKSSARPKGVVTVYISNFADTESRFKILDAIKANPSHEYRVFCHNSFKVNATEATKVHSNISINSFDRGNFLKSIDESEAVIGTAGHQLISEMVSMEKPMLAVPVQSYEQNFNALMVEKLGFGAYCRNLNADCVREFLANVRANDFDFAPARSLRLPPSLDTALATVKKLTV